MFVLRSSFLNRKRFPLVSLNIHQLPTNNHKNYYNSSSEKLIRPRISNKIKVMGGSLANKVLVPSIDNKTTNYAQSISIYKESDTTFNDMSTPPFTLYDQINDIWFNDLSSYPSLGYIEDPIKVEYYNQVQTQLLNCTNTSLSNILSTAADSTEDSDTLISSERLFKLIDTTENGIRYMNSAATWSILVLLCERHEDSKLTLHQFNIILQNMVKCIPFNQQVPSLITRNAIQLLKKLKENGHSPNHETFTYFYKAFKDSYPHLHAIHSNAMNTIKEQERKLNQNYRLNQSNTLGRKQDSKEGSTIPEGIILSEYSFRTLLAAYNAPTHSFSPTDISPLWYDMKTLGLKPTLATCVGFLQLAQKMKDERLLMEVHKIMETIPNWTATVYLEVMMGYQKFNKWLACQHLYQKMIEKTIPLTTLHYRAIFLSGKGLAFLANRNMKYADQMRSENIYADSDTYAEIIQSCIVLQDGSAIRQFVDTPIQMKFDQRIQKAQHMTSKEIEQEFKSNGLSLRVYNDLIHGFAKLGDTRAMERTFLKHTQIQQTLKSLHKEYNDIFSWSLKGASIGMYASMVYCYGVRFDSNSLRKCVGELFDSIILERVWEHEILKIERVKQDKLKELDKEIEEIEGNDQFVGVKYVKYRADKIKGVKKRATHLDTESYSIKYNDEFIKVPFIVGDHIGVNGPFKSIYASFIEGWTRALELMKDEPKVHVEGEFGIEIDIGMPRLKEYFSTHRYKKLEKSDVLAKMEQLLDDIRAVEHDAVNSLLIQRYRTKCIEE